MTFVFRLSKYIAVPILIDWLSLIDLVLLETSCGVKDSKKLVDWFHEFHNVLKSDVVPRCASLNSGLLPWAATHKCNVSECLFLLDELSPNLSISCEPSKNNVKKIVLNQLISMKILTRDIAPGIDLGNLLEFYFESGPPEIMMIIASSCRLLRKCHINHIQMKEGIIQSLCRNCPDLIDLAYGNKSSGLEQGVLTSIAVHAKNLQHLSLSLGVSKRKEWYVFAMHCRSQLLSLIWAETGDGTAITEILTYEGSSLTTLILPNNFIWYHIPDNIHKLCPNLTRLNLGASLVGASDIAELLSHLPQLTSFSAPRDHGLTEVEYDMIAESCKELRHWGSVEYKISIPEASVGFLTSKCRKLTSLHFIYKDLTDECALHIANNCPLLTELYMPFNKQLTDRSIKALAQSCPQLRELDLNMCEYVPGMKGPADIGDSSAVAISRHCRELVMLNMMGCSVSNLGAALLNELPTVLCLLLLGSNVSEGVLRAIKGQNSKNERKYSRYKIAKKYCT